MELKCSTLMTEPYSTVARKRKSSFSAYLSLPPSLPFPSFIDDLMPRCAVHTTVKAAPSCIDRISFDKSEDYSENCDKRHSK